MNVARIPEGFAHEAKGALPWGFLVATIDSPSRVPLMRRRRVPWLASDRKRGKGGEPRRTSDRALLGDREQRQLSRKRAGERAASPWRGPDDESAAAPARRRTLHTYAAQLGTNTAAPRKGRVTSNSPAPCGACPKRWAYRHNKSIRQLMALGTMATIKPK